MKIKGLSLRQFLRELMRARTLKKAFKFGIVGGIGLGEANLLFFFFAHVVGVWDQLAINLTTFIVAFSNFVGNVLVGNIPLAIEGEKGATALNNTLGKAKGGVKFTKRKSALLISVGILAVLSTTFYFAPMFTPTSPRLTMGYSTAACTPFSIKTPNPSNASQILEVFPASVSYHVEIWNTATPGLRADTNKAPSQQYYICNELVVNDGLDILASLDGQNKTGSPVYMEASTASSFSATDTTCTSGLTTNGFTRQDTSSTYAHSTGTNTYTIFGQWTYTAATSTVVAGACLLQHSGNTLCTGAAGATHCLVDESATSATATVNANGDVVKITATITV